MFHFTCLYHPIHTCDTHVSRHTDIWTVTLNKSLRHQDKQYIIDCLLYQIRGGRYHPGHSRIINQKVTDQAKAEATKKDM